MDVRLCQETLFDNPDQLEWDLGTAARRARLLAWTYEKVCTAEFSTAESNEFAWQLGELFLGFVAGVLDKAATVGEVHHKARAVEASSRTNAAWETYFRDHLAKIGRSASDIDAELDRARLAMPRAVMRG